MDSIVPECTEVKHKYDKCFNHWFSARFLKGDTTLPDSCEDLFEEYQKCIKNKIHTEHR